MASTSLNMCILVVCILFEKISGNLLFRSQYHVMVATKSTLFQPFRCWCPTLRVAYLGCHADTVARSDVICTVRSNVTCPLTSYRLPSDVTYCIRRHTHMVVRLQHVLDTAIHPTNKLLHKRKLSQAFYFIYLQITDDILEVQI